MFKYFPHTSTDIKEMLAKIGINSLRELFSEVPSEIMYQGEYNIPPHSHSEMELVKKNRSNWSKKNQELISFLGAGSYDVYVPSVIEP